MKHNMYLYDWIIVPVWCSIFALGSKTGMLIMAPVVLVFGILNTVFARKTVSLVTVDINLMMAAVTGIILNSLLFTRFIYADRENVSNMIVDIFAEVFYITFIMIFSLVVKDARRSYRRRIINRLAYEDDNDDDEDDDDYEYDDDDDDDGLLDEDEDDMRIEKRFAGGILRKSSEDEDDDDDEEDAPDRKSKEPKFKVIKKK